MDQLNKSAAKRLLEKYSAGICTPEEEQQVMRWYYAFGPAEELSFEAEKRKLRLKEIKTSTLSAVRSSGPRRAMFQLKPVAAIAAVFLLMISIGLFFMDGDDRRPSPAEVYRQVIAAAGQRKMVMLSDGTKIWLNSTTRLKYPESFKAVSRTVYLEGEAFFEVVHNDNKPFIVHAGKLKIQVLGTSFNVKSFKEEKEASVTVATGKVGVSKTNGNTYIMLLPGQQGMYREGELIRRSADLPESMAWQNNTLVFRSQPLGVILKELERWYGVKIICRNKVLLTKKYTLKQKNESLNNVLEILSGGEFHYIIQGKTARVW